MVAEEPPPPSICLTLSRKMQIVLCKVYHSIKATTATDNIIYLLLLLISIHDYVPDHLHTLLLMERIIQWSITRQIKNGLTKGYNFNTIHPLKYAIVACRTNSINAAQQRLLSIQYSRIEFRGSSGDSCTPNVNASSPFNYRVTL